MIIAPYLWFGFDVEFEKEIVEYLSIDLPDRHEQDREDGAYGKTHLLSYYASQSVFAEKIYHNA